MIEVINLKKNYDKKIAVNNLNFQIKKGQIIADYDKFSVVAKPGRKLVQMERGINTECRYDSLCKNTCNDEVDNLDNIPIPQLDGAAYKFS